MTPQVIHLDRHRCTADETARIGPNAVIQTLGALRVLEGATLAEALRTEADLPDPIPLQMIPERWFLDLVHHVRRVLPRDRAEAVLNRSGYGTADYVARNRIPSLVRLAFKILPRQIAVPLLLRAIRKHAWTFVGAGRMRLLPSAIELADCPTCRESGQPFSGGYYAAAFQRLLVLADPRIRVRETECVARGHGACIFTLTRE
ncbi:MAG: bacteriochlorophyll 4-vinyl reductase [Myxococcota bacterium]